MTKEGLSEHEQAMEGLPGSEIDGQSQAVKVSTLAEGTSKINCDGTISLSKKAVAFAVLLRNHQGIIIVWKEGRIILLPNWMS
ncbi:unnamed protein product [Camellia sinensis]